MTGTTRVPLLAACAGAVFAGAISRAQEPPAVNDAPATTAAAPEATKVTVLGRVVTFDGTALADVSVRLGKDSELVTADVFDAPLLRTGADGKFRFTVDAPTATDTEPLPLLFLAQKGRAGVARGINLKTKKARGNDELPEYEAETDLGDLVLMDGTRLFGRVRDADGKPVVGARVVAHDLLERSRFFQGQNFAFFCAALSDKSGIFSLPCALGQGVALDVSVPGCYQLLRSPVATGTPLELTLQKSGLIAGRVLDENGKGVAGAFVNVAYETQTAAPRCRTEADGSFHTTLLQPSRYRITASAPQKDGTPRAGRRGRGTPMREVHSDVLTGPHENLELQLPAAKKDDKKRDDDEPLAVKAIDKKTSKPVTEFTATSVWEEWANRNANYLDNQLRNNMQWNARRAEDGVAKVAGPGKNGTSTGVVEVLSKGYAPAIVKEVEWKELDEGAARPPLAVELVAESTISGVVKDEASGAGIAEAKVWARPRQDPNQGIYRNGDPNPDEAVTTAADGSFTLPQLGEGQWEVLVRHPKRPTVPPEAVELAAEEQKTGVAVVLPVGSTVTGKLTGVTVGRGWKVSLQPLPKVTYGGYQNGYYRPNQEQPAFVDLHDDGSFAFDGVKLDSYMLVLKLPSLPRCGGDLYMPLEPMRVRPGGVQRELDLGTDQPGSIAGKVTFAAAAVPFDRLVVVAQTYSDDGNMFFGPWNIDYRGPRALVDQGGGYHLRLGPGQYLLQLVDMATGVRLDLSDKPVRVDASATVTRDLTPKLLQMRLKLEQDAQAATMATVDRIELRVTPKVKNQNNAAFGNNDNYDTGVGVQFEPGQTEALVVLPEAQVIAFARNLVSGLRVDDHRHENPPLGRAEFETSAEPGKTEVVLKIGAPPEIPEDKPKNDGKDAGAKKDK